MSFKYDLYIIFPDSGDKDIAKSWISNFKSFLEILLEKLLKRKISIVLCNDKNAGEAKNGASSYILILDDNHLNKKYQDELNEIVKLVKTGFEKRIYKVFTTKLDSPALPQSLMQLINYNFYRIDAETGNTIDFLEIKGDKDEKLFWLKLVDLTYDIYNNIIKLNNIEKEKIANSLKTIFLAETREDQFENRDIIKRELLQHGYNLVPDKHLNLAEKNFKDNLKQYLDESCMAIHIISENYNQDQTEENSICAIQNTFAATYYTELEKQNKEHDLQRIIWISPDLNLKTEKQRNQIAKLKQNAEALTGAEVVQTPIELLKTVIHNRLNENYIAGKKERSIKINKKSKNDILSVYLIYDKTDTENIKSVSKYFEDYNFEILRTSFDGNEYELIKQHKSKLVKCDIVLIYSNINHEWLISKLKDIKKSPGFGRKKPFLSKIIYYLDKQKINIDKFEKDKFLLLNGKTEFDPKILDPLFKKVK